MQYVKMWSWINPGKEYILKKKIYSKEDLDGVK